MELSIKKPIIIFDLETTGIDISKDRIVEISIIKVMPDGKEHIKNCRINPEMPISAQSTAIHGITNDDVKNCPTFKEVAKNLAMFIDGCDVVGYNSIRFDVPVLVEEFLRVGVEIDFRKRKMIDVQNIFHKMEQRTLSAAYKFYCKKDMENAHSAEADTRATYEILQAQLDCYPDLENDVNYLSKFSTRTRNVDYAGRIVLNDKDEPVFNFGKHKGKQVKVVLDQEATYYSWMMNGDFTLDTKRVLTEIRLSMING